jgi:hypothetical protein
MSKHAIIKTELSDLKAVCAALDRLHLKHTVNGKVVTVDQNAHGYEAWVDLIIFCDTGQVKVDDMRKDVMQNINLQYAYVKAVDEVSSLGFNLSSEEKVNGETVLIMDRWV